MILRLVLSLASTSTAIMNRGGDNKCDMDRVVTRMENVTRMINVTETVQELCLDLSEGFRCDRELTHFVPRMTVETREHTETVTSCCPGYISDGGDGCVKTVKVPIHEEEEGSGEDVRPATRNGNKSEDNYFMSDEENIIKDLIAPFFTQQPVKGDRCGPQCCECPPPFNVVDLGKPGSEECFCSHRPDQQSIPNQHFEKEQMEMETANFTMYEDTVENFKCAAFKWGRDCSLVCHCNHDGAYGCDRYTGHCLCNGHWTGEKCQKNDGVLMTVVLSISLLLLTLIVIGFISINIMRRTYYDLERRRKMKERNKKEKLASIVQKREEEYPKSKYPSPSLLNNPTYGILNDGYETEKIKDMTVDMKILASIFDVQPDEYDHLDYNRSINELSETYCNGTHV